MWKCIFGDWTPVAQEGFKLWLEDKIEEVTSTIRTVTMRNSVGKFFENSNTLDVI